jgi:hypothetical protein
MAFIRPYLLAALIPMSLVACGGDDGGGTVTPEGMHYHYVANKAFVPTNNNQARDYGLDLNGDGTVDNQLGMVLGTLAGMGFDVQGTIDKAVNEGSIILLVDFQTKDFMNAAAAGLQVFLGTNPVPPACNGSADTTCGHHLDGNGMFSISADSPDNAALSGKLVNGTFTGGDQNSNVTLQIALGGTDAITLDLIGARAKVSGITETGMTSAVVGGALTQEDLNTKVLPAIKTQLDPVIARDCHMLTSPPDCGCDAGTTGKQILSLFDADPKDCKVTVPEIMNNALIKSLLAPDVTLQGKMALSLGIKVTTVKGTFTVAGQ